MGAVGSWPEAQAAFADLTSDSKVVQSTPNDLADEIELIEQDLGASGAGGAGNISFRSLLKEYRDNCEVQWNSTSQITVALGQITVKNAAGSISMFKENAAAITLDSGDVDDGGGFDNSAQYFIYAIGDADSSTFWGSLSTSPAPSGISFFKKLGQFRTDSGGNILGVGNVRGSGFNFWHGDFVSIDDISSASTPIYFSDYGDTQYVFVLQFSTSNAGDGANLSIIFRDSAGSLGDGLSQFELTSNYMGFRLTGTPRYPSGLSGAGTLITTSHFMRLMIT